MSILGTIILRALAFPPARQTVVSTLSFNRTLCIPTLSLSWFLRSWFSFIPPCRLLLSFGFSLSARLQMSLLQLALFFFSLALVTLLSFPLLLKLWYPRFHLPQVLLFPPTIDLSSAGATQATVSDASFFYLKCRMIRSSTLAVSTEHSSGTHPSIANRSIDTRRWFTHSDCRSTVNLKRVAQ